MKQLTLFLVLFSLLSFTTLQKSKKEVLFKSDVEALIGKRPFEEKKILDVEEPVVIAETPSEPTPAPENPSAEDNTGV